MLHTLACAPIWLAICNNNSCQGVGFTVTVTRFMHYGFITYSRFFEKCHVPLVLHRLSTPCVHGLSGHLFTSQWFTYVIMSDKEKVNEDKSKEIYTCTYLHRKICLGVFIS